MTIGQFAEALTQYCALTGGSTTSGIRSTKHNHDKDGKPNSPHLYARGADVIYDTTPPRAEALVRAARLGLRLIREGDHDHLQPLDWPAG